LSDSQFAIAQDVAKEIVSAVRCLMFAANSCPCLHLMFYDREVASY